MNGPLIVQSDRTVLLEVAHPDAEDARHDLAVFAELERAPEHVHTYRITRLGLWNARAAGHDAESMIHTLEHFAKFPVPQSVTVDIRDTVARYGRLVIRREERPDAPAVANSPTEELERQPVLLLTASEPTILAEVIRSKRIKPLLGDMRPRKRSSSCRGHAGRSSRSS